MDLVDRTLALLRIPSVTGAEAALCDFLAQQLASCPALELQRIGDNLVAWPRARARPLVALVGHLDTVPPARDNPPRRDGDRIYGLGASDMKAGLALIWDLAADPVPDAAYDVALLLYAREEGPYARSGLVEVFAVWPRLAEIALAICLEPTDNELHIGCLGVINAEVTFAGRAAHSARPWQGENAIHKAAPLLARLASAQPAEHRCGALTYREVISATTAQGGTARNVLPDRFQLNLNYRFPPGRSLDDARRYVLELVDGAAAVRFVDQAPAGRVPEQNAILDDLVRKCRVTVAAKQAWTDVARFAEAGIDAVNLGPGIVAQAHQPDEHAAAAQLLAAGELLRTFLAR